jgi:hypothetical protein
MEREAKEEKEMMLQNQVTKSKQTMPIKIEKLQ